MFMHDIICTKINPIAKGIKTMENIFRPEHPNPQFQRKSWMNLNGVWDFEFDFGKSGRERKMYENGNFTKKINVPFCPESKLSGIEYKDFMNGVWYRRTFELTDCSTKRTVIHFGAVDYKSFVYINGKEAGMHLGGYSSFSYDITDLCKDGENTVVVYAEENMHNGLQPVGKQSRSFYSHGCDYTRTTGIWQTVWLEFTPKDHIVSFKLYPDISASALHISAELKGLGKFSAKASFEGKECGSVTFDKTASSGNTVNVTLNLSDLHLWEIGKGGLYDLDLTFGDDEVHSYFGMREVRLEGNRFILNGKSVFLRTVLDQGFYPDGIYTAPSDEALINDIKISMDMGFNGARLHQKVFEARFLYHCDRLGYLVWGEHANWGLDLSNPMALHSFLKEWLEIVTRDFNHPALIGWCPFNETWDYDGRQQLDDNLLLIYRTTKLLDRTRPCIDTSGNFHVHETDIYDLHDYEQDVEKFKHTYSELAKGGSIIGEGHVHRQQYDFPEYRALPLFISEYGGIKWDVDSNNAEAWGYGAAPKTEEEFLNRYKGLTEVLLSNKNIFGFCYTQLYDIEQETNGLYTYGRKAKFDPAFFKKVNSQKAAIED